MNSEMQLQEQVRAELKYIAHRQTDRLLKKLSPVVNLPDIAMDCIRQYVEYATKEGARSAMRQSRKGESVNDTQDRDDQFNR